MRKEKTKDAHYAQYLNSGDGASREAGEKHVTNAMLTRGAPVFYFFPMQELNLLLSRHLSSCPHGT